LLFIVYGDIMKVLGVKLVTGQEFFANCEYTTDGRLKATGMVSLRMMPARIQGGEPTMAFVPFLEMADHEPPQSLLIEPLHIVYTYVPYQDLITEYNNMFTQNTGTQQIITG
jgi:hypothetical protein